MIGTMEVPTGYRIRLQSGEARSGLEGQGMPREGSVFYESPTAFIRRMHAEGVMAQGATTPRTVNPEIPMYQGPSETPTGFIRRAHRESGLISGTEISDRVAKETLVFERALNVLTGGRPAQERIKELREQEAAYVLLHNAYRGMKRLETAAAQLLIHAIQYNPL